jgi:hypothetical protein
LTDHVERYVAPVDAAAFVWPKKLVQIQPRFTLIARHNAPENFIAAFGTIIAGFFILDPFFSPKLPPIRNGPQDNLFADSHGEIVNVPAGKFITLMTSRVALFLGALPDIALPAMHKQVIREAAAALDVCHGKLFTVGEGAFAINVSLVKIHQPFFEFFVVIPICDINGTDAAIKSARGNKIRIYRHNLKPSCYCQNTEPDPVRGTSR